ncbi:MAG: Gfo/Idh/MocA family oxidoreductase [Clostridia bacterium]|nr:Gfo/Idh/MocA family oxidoreductase [Clostridia bacterium]
MEPFRIGVLGVADHFILRVLNPILKSDKVQVYAIASRNVQKAKAAAEKWGFPVFYGSYEELLADDKVEGVYIPLPNHMHAEWIKKCADAGKHVLCEKPLTLDSKQAEDVVKYVDSKGVKLMEAFMYRFHPKWKRAKELVEHGEIGKVLSIHTVFSYQNNDPKNIRNIKEYGGGALMDIGCYAISTARYITGKEPERVVGLNHYDPDFDTDILSSGMLDFGTVRCMFTVGTQMFPEQEVAIFGTGGSITVTIPFNDFPDVEAKIIVKTSIGTREVRFDPTDQYRLEFEGFAQAVREDKEVPTPPQDAINNMKVIDALLESGRKGTWVKL